MSKKETILLAAAKLFADHSYHAVGIRDIAVKAKANSSLISYYFGGKSGLLLEIIQRFIGLYLDALTKAIEESKDREEFIGNLVRRSIISARSNRRLYMVGLKELYVQNEPKIQEVKEHFEEERWHRLAAFFRIDETRPQKSKLEREIVFKATTAMVFSDYLIGDGLIVDDDDQVETYIKVVADLVRRGVPKAPPQGRSTAPEAAASEGFSPLARL